jgi:membrane-bound metal-dependent hydrolase YbcI (DUF457 family)
LILSGVAPDLDYASYFLGPSSFLSLHRSAFHSIAGAAAMSSALAGLFYALDRKWPPKKSHKRQAPPLKLASALALCAIGVAGHDLLDLASAEGIQLLWPFQAHWSRWDLAASFDPWILILLIAGLLIPQLFRLVGEEVGAPRKRTTGTGAAVATLLLLSSYLGARAYLHWRAVEMMLSSEYHGREPLSVGAFPSSSDPFDWRGIVSTDNTLEEIDVSLASGADFNPDRSLKHYKPADSEELEIAENTATARRFLKYAEYPLASVARREDGYRVELRDLRFPAGDEDPANIIARADLSGSFQIIRDQLLYAFSENN